MLMSLHTNVIGFPRIRVQNALLRGTRDVAGCDVVCVYHPRLLTRFLHVPIFRLLSLPNLPVVVHMFFRESKTHANA